MVTSILHDTIEDTELTKDMLEYIFDSNIASKVDDLTRIKIDRKISSAEMVQLLYISKKYNLLLIKMFDRVHNMQTIKYKSIEKSKKITDETLKSFLTLSAYFRLKTLKNIDVEEQITQLCYQSISNNLTTNDLNLFLENCFFQLPPLPEFQND